MMKSHKILKFQHLTMKVDGQSGLIHIMGFITHICRLLLDAHVGGSVDIKQCYIFKKLKIAILASGSVLAQGTYFSFDYSFYLLCNKLPRSKGTRALLEFRHTKINYSSLDTQLCLFC